MLSTACPSETLPVYYIRYRPPAIIEPDHEMMMMMRGTMGKISLSISGSKQSASNHDLSSDLEMTAVVWLHLPRVAVLERAKDRMYPALFPGNGYRFPSRGVSPVRKSMINAMDGTFYYQLIVATGQRHFLFYFWVRPKGRKKDDDDTNWRVFSRTRHL